jgi:CheY-like chemotaxis protein
MRTLSLIVAEDDQLLREWMVTVLAGLHAHVRQASSGIQLLALLADGCPVDLVISDVRMPGMGGIDALRRARAAGFDMPFLFVTGFARDEAGTAEELGAAVLEKPISVGELLARVRALCPPVAHER